jgi:hypothetical protein
MPLRGLQWQVQLVGQLLTNILRDTNGDPSMRSLALRSCGAGVASPEEVIASFPVASFSLAATANSARCASNVLRVANWALSELGRGTGTHPTGVLRGRR